MILGTIVTYDSIEIFPDYLTLSLVCDQAAGFWRTAPLGDVHVRAIRLRSHFRLTCALREVAPLKKILSAIVDWLDLSPPWRDLRFASATPFIRMFVCIL